MNHNNKIICSFSFQVSPEIYCRSYKNVFKRIHKYEYDGVLLIFFNMTKYATACIYVTSFSNKIRTLSYLRLSTPVIKYVKYDQLRIRRIQKYEYAQPKYDSEKPKYAHKYLP